MNIHIDFETYSECDLKKCGAWIYSTHPSTEVLCMAYAIDNEPVQLWLPNEPLPLWVMTSNRLCLQVPEFKIHAWNCFFEYCIWHNTLKWRSIPDPRFWDNTQAHAMASSLPRSLGECAEVLTTQSDKQKDKRGARLIQKLCKPYRGKHIQDKTLLNELYDYCRQDVVTERHIASLLHPKTAITPSERELWELDFKMNIEGLPIDTFALDAAIELYHQEFIRLKARLMDITQLENPKSPKQFLAWLHAQGVMVDNTQSTTLKQLLLDNTLSETLQEAIKLRIQIAKTPIAKYEVIAERTSSDNRLRGFQLYHAATTGRFSSTGVNFQNLPRPVVEDVDTCIELIYTRQYDELRAKHADIMEVLSSSIRGMIKAPEGKRFYLADYAAIEARVLAWLSGQENILEIFRTDGKLYEQAAASIYHIDINDVDKAQRTVGKIATLALGYAGGYRAFQKMAINYQVDISDEEAQAIVYKWRQANSAITEFWHACNQAAIQAINDPFSTYKVKHILFRSDGKQLWAKLPSGRKLTWNTPTIKDNQIHYKGVDTITGKWTQLTTYGGDIVQSLTQAVARDVMANAMLCLDKQGFNVRLTVHDEIIVEVDPKNKTLATFMDIMNQAPAWAKGLPIAAEGELSQRYKK
ncbi:DNA polymerase [Cysteiniphilum halobium]|uniref:DNA polymerase n=1 Tax=Cysteiniphilum halobium TaxID=2219059 RepID=UPI003F862E5F